MEKITEKNCIVLIKEKFPKFHPYWKSFIKNFGLDQGLTIQMIPFGDYTIDLLKSHDEVELQKIFDFVEFLLCYGDESVQNAITTGFLEYLMHNDPDKIQFSKFVKYLGENSINYCRAWDEFNGTRTEGLWGKDTNE